MKYLKEIYTTIEDEENSPEGKLHHIENILFDYTSSGRVELVCTLADEVMKQKYENFDDIVESNHGGQGGTQFIAEYQDEFNELYDKIENILIQRGL